MKLDVWQKDVGIIADFASDAGSATPLFSASAPLYTAAIEMGAAEKTRQPFTPSSNGWRR
ncbi:MAG: hypothetical protein AUH43_18160 [Acidobacteria bacterium 13_1_40CM_65_14]|nr:MAG: hypothetical protein AUH43_18160 [Acidobacteria bacterium 13_1_40CM_65_14]OLE80341.1 MAG: hypothetical protein AUF76_15015 [Acidobacteria bacterium 13_1_20CM_2_65_9]